MSENKEPDKSDAAAHTTHLSDAELHDVIVVATAANEAEMLYLSERLEEAGIPLARLSESIRYHNPLSSRPEIRVPRVLAIRAREIIDAARVEAEHRAVDNAFDQESVEQIDAKDVKRDNTLALMLTLKSLPAHERNPQLALCIIDWFASGRSNIDISRYLAAAGLTQDEARALVADVYEQQKDEIQRKQAAGWNRGLIFIVLGVLVFAVGSRPMLGVIVAMIGLAIMYNSSKSPGLLQKPEVKPEPPTDGENKKPD